MSWKETRNSLLADTLKTYGVNINKLPAPRDTSTGRIREVTNKGRFK